MKFLLNKLAEMLKVRGLTISVAESCTGGTITSLLASVSGASRYLLLGCIAYSESMKIKLLGVSGSSIEQFTAVSSEVAREMAMGARKLASSDIGLSTTGYAGPLGGDENNPVGTIYVGISTIHGTLSLRFTFSGERQQVIDDASMEVLRTLYKMLLNGELGFSEDPEMS